MEPSDGISCSPTPGISGSPSLSLGSSEMLHVAPKRICVASEQPIQPAAAKQARLERSSTHARATTGPDGSDRMSAKAPRCPVGTASNQCRLDDRLSASAVLPPVASPCAEPRGADNCGTRSMQSVSTPAQTDLESRWGNTEANFLGDSRLACGGLEQAAGAIGSTASPGASPAVRSRRLPTSAPAPRRGRRLIRKPMPAFPLLNLPEDLIQCNVLTRLDGKSLAALHVTHSAFASPTESAAKTTLLARLAAGADFDGDDRCATLPAPSIVDTNRGIVIEQPVCYTLEDRQDGSWKYKLFLEEAFCSFCPPRGWSQQTDGFRFTSAPSTSNPDAGSVMTSVFLDGMGPMLLLSDLSTLDRPCLRWRATVVGNTAIEFGVVPVGLEHSGPTALHKAKKLATGNSQAVGFASEYTHGSELDARAQVMRGTTVEVLVRPGAVDYTLYYPENIQELVWRDGFSVLQPYAGPRVRRFSQELPAHMPVRLACTLWAHGKLELAQPMPPAPPVIGSPASTPRTTVPAISGNSWPPLANMLTPTNAALP